MEPRTRLRIARPNDLPTIMAMTAYSRQLMRDEGNKGQWINGYPSETLYEEDIAKKRLYIIEDDQGICGSFAFIEGAEPTYQEIEGAWESDRRPYGTLHRIAKREGTRGIFGEIVRHCATLSPTLRIDTHNDNITMRHLIEKEGFSYCGIIHVADGSPRRAYQLLHTGGICQRLRDYVAAELMPRYAAFDTAHRQPHIERVIANSLEYAKPYDVDLNMVYAAASYHDLGLCEGRERHHIVSGIIVRGDERLSTWFDAAQIETIAQAVEDHRASSKEEPRSLYGRILAEADRDIVPDEIILRTVQYSLSHYPEYDKEQHWERCKAHFDEKYGRQGYLKLWIPDTPNATALESLRKTIDDKKALRMAFEEKYTKIASDKQ